MCKRYYGTRSKCYVELLVSEQRASSAGAVLGESKVDFGQIIGAMFMQVSGRIWKPFVVKEI